jgi:hypothetical protein
MQWYTTVVVAPRSTDLAIHGRSADGGPVPRALSY